MQIVGIAGGVVQWSSSPIPTRPPSPTRTGARSKTSTRSSQLYRPANHTRHRAVHPRHRPRGLPPPPRRRTPRPRRGRSPRLTACQRPQQRRRPEEAEYSLFRTSATADPFDSSSEHSRSLARGCVFVFVRSGLTHNRLVRGNPGGLIDGLEKVLEAREERVFAACVEPEKLAEWWGIAGSTTPSVELDLRDGRGIPDHDAAAGRRGLPHAGEFSQVDPPRRLVYTFEWEKPDPDDQETVVTLSFLKHREGTRLMSTRGRLQPRLGDALHESGWTETLSG